MTLIIFSPFSKNRIEKFHGIFFKGAACERDLELPDCMFSKFEIPMHSFIFSYGMYYPIR